MLRIHRSLFLVPTLVALCVLVAGCGSSSTGPQTTPSAYAGSYKGIVEGAGSSGTVAITVGQVSADITRGPALHAESNPDAVTVTLMTQSGSIVLTGTISGAVATVASTTPPANCTITFTPTGATGSCTANGQPLSLVAFLLANGIEVATYCGTQSAGGVATVAPTATLGAVVSGPNMYLLVTPPTGMPTLFTGSLANNNVSLTSGSSAAVYTGTETNSGATISGTITSGGSGSWSVLSPCTQGTLVVSTYDVPVSAPLGSTGTITLSPVTISNGGGSATLGVLELGPATYTPSTPNGWLLATLNSPTTTGGTLSLSVTPPSGIAAGMYSAAVPVIASLGNGSPVTVTVSLTINAPPAPVLVAPGPVTLNTTAGTAPAGQTVSVTSTGGTASGLSTSIAYGSASGWLTATIAPAATPATLSLSAPGATGLAAGNYSATVTIASTTTGVASIPLTVNLDITAAACTITTSPTLPTLTVGTVADVLLTTTGPCPPTGSDTWTVTSGSFPAGLAIPLGGTLPEIYGAPTASGNYGAFTVNLMNAGVSAASLTFDAGTVLAATVCEIGPNPEPNGTDGVLYAQGFVASLNCTSPSDDASLWSWGVSTGLPPGLTFDSPLVGVKDVGLTGTPTKAGTFNFTVTFTNANQVAGHNEASATQAYTMTIYAAPAGARVRTAVTRIGSRAGPRAESRTGSQ